MRRNLSSIGAEIRDRQRATEILDLCGPVGEIELARTALDEGHDVSDVRRLLALSGNRVRSPLLGMTLRECSEYSLRDAIDCAADLKRAGLPRDIHNELERLHGTSKHGGLLLPIDIFVHRDLNVAGAAAGGYTVATAPIGFIEASRGRSVLVGLGAMPLEGLVGNVTIPSLATGATTQWLGTETTTPSESSPTFGQITLEPHTVAAYLEVSRQLLGQGRSVDAMLRSDLLSAVGEAVDVAGLAGSGADGQPAGLTNALTATSGASFDSDAADTMQASIDSSVLDDASAVAWATTPGVARLLKRRHEVASVYAPLWRGSAYAGLLDGLPARSSTRCPADTLVLGDWATVVIGGWGVAELAVNPYADFKGRKVALRVMLDLDIAMRRPSAFAAATSVS